MRVKTGIDRLIASDFAQLRGLRVALFSNLNAVDHTLRPTYDILAASPHVDLKLLLGPEHGFVGAAREGEKVLSSTEARTGLPIYSLYGGDPNSLAEAFAQVDLILCDIQDIGVRYYTYIWTLSHLLDHAAQHQKTVLILDRPNPLGGKAVRGTPLDTDQSSLVGRFPVPTQHGMTLGELAQLINQTWLEQSAVLDVLLCEGWHRAMLWEDTGLTWVAPSPNMPSIDAVRHYPGSCLIEGTSLSEGRGTPLPFSIVGAPHLDAFVLAEALNALEMAGVGFRPHLFTPYHQKYEGEVCQGVQAHITDIPSYDALHVWLQVLQVIYQQGGFEWCHAHFDRLLGQSHVRRFIESGEDLGTFLGEWEHFCGDFLSLRAPFLLYGED